MAQTKPQQDRPRGLWETLEQLSMAGAKGPWGRQEGWTGPDQEFSNPDRCLGSALMALRSREGPRRVMTGTTCGMATLAAESELGQVGGYRHGGPEAGRGSR